MEIETLVAEIKRLRGALAEIQMATINGKVCDDVAWFDDITTLHDFCAVTLDVTGMMPDEFRTWCQLNKKPLMSADELLSEGGHTEEQRAWLVSFIARWEERLALDSLIR